MDARLAAEFGEVRRRVLTLAGVYVNEAVANGATSHVLAFPQTEPSTSYGVTVCPSWNTTVWVTSKTTTGCTVNFGTAAGASDVIDVWTFKES